MSFLCVAWRLHYSPTPAEGAVGVEGQGALGSGSVWRTCWVPQPLPIKAGIPPLQRGGKYSSNSEGQQREGVALALPGQCVITQGMESKVTGFMAQARHLSSSAWEGLLHGPGTPEQHSLRGVGSCTSSGTPLLPQRETQCWALCSSCFAVFLNSSLLTC